MELVLTELALKIVKLRDHVCECFDSVAKPRGEWRAVVEFRLAVSLLASKALQPKQINTLCSIMKKNCTDSAGIDQIKKSLYQCLFFCNPCARAKLH